MAKDGVFQKIYGAARRIPAGRVASYGQLARSVGMVNGARIAGWAMMACPDDVPAHRVVHADGRLCSGHQWEAVQRRLLAEEGIVFKQNGNVDMEKCTWEGEEDGALPFEQL